MKLKTTLILFALCIGMVASAQDTFKSCYVQGDSCFSVTYERGTVTTTIPAPTPNCSGHLVYNAPAGKSPKKLRRLGTNPQFGTLRFYSTTQEVYDHLNKAYSENQKGNAAELDKLWRAMGYSGFKDPSYTVNQLTPVFYDPGIVGMLGAGGNRYVYAEVHHNDDAKVKGYRVTAAAGCDITIMEICGNAFFPQGYIDQGSRQFVAARTQGYSGPNAGTTSTTSSTGSRMISKKGCPIGVDLTNKTAHAYIQDGQCYVRVCDNVNKNGNNPVKVSSLAHNQQFGPMTDAKTPTDFVDRLNALYTENKSGNAAEIDRLLQTIGYSGLSDPNFNVNQITLINYEGGVAAVMGGGEHQYMFSEISTENYENLRGFQIKSQNEKCDLVFIDVCGNALYCPQPMNCQNIPCGCN